MIPDSNKVLDLLDAINEANVDSLPTMRKMFYGIAMLMDEVDDTSRRQVSTTFHLLTIMVEKKMKERGIPVEDL